MKVIIFSSPSRKIMLDMLLYSLSSYDVTVIDDPETFGKENYWKRWKKAYDICVKSKHDWFLFLPDDISFLNTDALHEFISRNRTRKAILNITSDERTSCWGNAPTKSPDINLRDAVLIDQGFFDCGGLMNRNTLLSLTIKPVLDRWFDRPDKSSGVGFMLTNQARKQCIPMYRPFPSLCFHGSHESVMHPEERRKTPLVSNLNILKVVGMATMDGREDRCRTALESLIHQVDRVQLEKNKGYGEGKTDNGKFTIIDSIRTPCYIFLCDDDIEYPDTYIQDTINKIEEHRCIVTYHGRKLVGKGKDYYRGHRAYDCFKENNEETEIDVCGTGVTAFRSDYFLPYGLCESEYKLMSDLVFSLEAAKQGKKIMLLKHGKNYFKDLKPDIKTKISAREGRNCSVQSELADKIWLIKNKS